MFKSSERQRQNAIAYYHRIKTDPLLISRRRQLQAKRKRERRAHEPGFSDKERASTTACWARRYPSRKADPEFIAGRNKSHRVWVRNRREVDPGYAPRVCRQTIEQKAKRMADPAYADGERLRVRLVHARMSDTVIAKLGGVCACCGETGREFLSVDHIHGGGTRHRKECGGTAQLYRAIRKFGYDRTIYRVLCMNCNWATRSGRECPHARREAISV